MEKGRWLGYRSSTYFFIFLVKEDHPYPVEASKLCKIFPSTTTTIWIISLILFWVNDGQTYYSYYSNDVT